MRKFLLILLSCSLYCLSNAQTKSGAVDLALRDNWNLQSSLKVSQKGEVIASRSFSPQDWHTITIPATIIGALVNTGVYKDPYFGQNLKTISGPEFDKTWWFRKTFKLPPSEKNKTVRLRFR